MRLRTLSQPPGSLRSWKAPGAHCSDSMWDLDSSAHGNLKTQQRHDRIISKLTDVRKTRWSRSPIFRATYLRWWNCLVSPWTFPRGHGSCWCLPCEMSDIVLLRRSRCVDSACWRRLDTADAIGCFSIKAPFHTRCFYTRQHWRYLRQENNSLFFSLFGQDKTFEDAILRSAKH